MMKLLLLLVWILIQVELSCQEKGIYSDKQIKQNIKQVDTNELLQRIQKLELKSFEYQYEQFYNPIFGKEQLGFVAQDVIKSLPMAVGSVEERIIPLPNNQKRVINNLLVLNQDHIYMANIGATQQLALNLDALQSKFDSISTSLASFDQTSTELIQAKTGYDRQFKSLLDELSDIQVKLKGNKLKLDDLILLEQRVADISLKLSNLQVEMKGIDARIDEKITKSVQVLKKDIDLLNSVSATVDATSKQLENITTSSSQLSHTIEQLKQKADASEQTMKEMRSKLELDAQQCSAEVTTLSDDVKLKLKNLEQLRAVDIDTAAKSTVELKASNLKLNEQINSIAEDIHDKLQEIQQQRAIDVQVSKQLDEQLKSVAEQILEGKTSVTTLAEKLEVKEEVLLDMISAVNVSNVNHDQVIQQLRHNVDAVVQVAESNQFSIDQLKASIALNVESIHQLNASITNNKLTIADAMAKAELQFGTLNSSITLLFEKVEKQAGIELTERRRILEAEAKIAQAKVDEVISRGEQDRLTEQHGNKLMMERLEKEVELKRQSEMELIRMREEAEKSRITEQMYADLNRTQAEQQIVLESKRLEIQGEAATERSNHDLRMEMERLKATEQREQAVVAIKTTISEISRVTASFASDSDNLVLVLGGMVTLFLAYFSIKEFVSLARYQLNRYLNTPSLVRETSRYAFTRSKAVTGFLTDVVLKEELHHRIRRISASIKTSHERNAPLRHIMFYGPPGTGKTMCAKAIAKQCGLDYAIMSGADVAPLKEKAVTELHALFRWAKSTRRGVLLFIDEADAFLCSRNNNISEHSRNALTALLYHTGSAAENKLMLVLATNRPKDLDYAVLDRVDEAIHFDTPAFKERYKLVLQYYVLNILQYTPPADSIRYLNDLVVENSTAIKLAKNQANKQEDYCNQEFIRNTLQPLLEARHQSKGWISRALAALRFAPTVTALSIRQIDAGVMIQLAHDVDGFSGREIYKLFASIQAHCFGAASETAGSSSPVLDRPALMRVAANAVDQHRYTRVETD